MADYYYYLGDWIWNKTEESWEAPAGTVGLVDLGTLEQAGTAGSDQNPTRGLGFFATIDPLDASYTLLGKGDLRELSADATVKSKWLGKTGYEPKGTKIVDLLFDQLTDGSDPDGETAVKSLMPNVAGNLDLHLGGHSKIKSEKFVWGVHSHTAKVKKILHKHFETYYNEVKEGRRETDHHRRILDFWCKQYGVTNWKEFVPNHLHSKVPGRLPHHTTITESFNTADSDTLGPDLSWTEVTNDIDIVSNKAQNGGISSLAEARADSDLSSDDHYAEAEVNCSTKTGGDQEGTLVRKDSTTTRTYYSGRTRYINDNLRLFKLVAAVSTTLGTSAALGLVATTPGTVRTIANGSAISANWNGSEVVAPVTDTDITGNTRTGIAGQKSISGTVTWDSFVAADLAGGSSIKTKKGLAYASVKTFKGLAIASVKTDKGLA